MSRNRKLIKSIGTVALTGVVATTALTGLTSCGKNKVSKEETIVISLSGEEAATDEACLTSSWLPLSEITANPTFRENFNTLTHNRTTSTNNQESNQKKEGTIYYTSNPTLQTSLKNTAFTTLFDSLDTTTLLSLTQDLYLDLDETTSPNIIKAAVINTYFNLFNTKQNASANEFNSTQRISRVDFITALVKSTTSPQSNESSLSENEIMLKLSDKSYLGVNNTNNTETGIITKAEAAYLVCNTLFNSEISEQKADKPAENLQACLESSELSSDLTEALDILKSKEIISNEFVANWNKALTKSEAVEMIYKSLKISGLSSDDVVSSDVIADEIAQKAAALNEKKETAHVLIGGYSRIDLDSWNEKIEAAESEEEVDSLVAEAGAEESNAIEAEKKAAAEEAAAAARNNSSSNSGTSGGRQVGYSVSGGSTTPSGGTTSGGGTSSGKTNSRNWVSGVPSSVYEKQETGDGGMNIK